MATKSAKRPTTKAKTSTAKAPRVTRVVVPSVKSAPAQARSKTGFAKIFEARYYRTLSFGALLAELLGTFILALTFMTVQGSQIFVFFAYVALVLVFAPMSGPHLNPVLSIGMWVIRRMSGLRAIGYVVAQFLGAMLAVVAATYLVPESINQLTGQAEAGKAFAVNALPDANNELWRLFAVELVGTLVLALGVASAFVTQRGLAAKALTMGGAYLLGLLIVQGQQLLNPAVALALEGLKMEPWPLAIYLLAPLLGAILGMALFRFMEKDAKVTPATLVDARPADSL